MTPRELTLAEIDGQAERALALFDGEAADVARVFLLKRLARRIGPEKFLEFALKTDAEMQREGRRAA